MRDHIQALAEKHGLDYQIDETGNLVVRKPGTAGKEKAETTVIQAHLDMVQEKNSDVDHDWASDPIRPQRDGVDGIGSRQSAFAGQVEMSQGEPPAVSRFLRHVPGGIWHARQIGARLEDEQALCWVADNGVGIEPADLERI